MDSTWHTHMPWVKVFKRFRACNFELVMNFGRFGQTTVDNSLWIVYETFRLAPHIWCFVVTMWCTITPSCALHVMLKGDFGTWCTHHKWNPKFDLLHDYFMLQTKLAVHGEKSYGTPWLCTHPSPKFEVIWIMLGELMANKYQIGFEWHDRLTSYLNYDSGLIIDG